MNYEPPSSTSKRRFWIAFLIIGGSITVTGLYFVLTTRPSHIPFDSQRGKDASLNRGIEIRQMMLLDLERNVLHRGMTIDEVESLLGRSSLSIPGDHDLAYMLGSSGAGVGSTSRSGGTTHIPGRNQWLTFTFDEHDRLVEWKIVSR